MGFHYLFKKKNKLKFFFSLLEHKSKDELSTDLLMSGFVLLSVNNSHSEKYSLKVRKNFIETWIWNEIFHERLV